MLIFSESLVSIITLHHIKYNNGLKQHDYLVMMSSRQDGGAHVYHAYFSFITVQWDRALIVKEFPLWWVTVSQYSGMQC